MRTLQAGMLALVGALIAGCGGSSSSHQSTVTSAPSATLHTPSATATTPRRPAHKRRQRTRQAPASSSPTGPGTRTAPPPIPSGTSPAPDGLRQTSGYTTYELCSSRCSGSVPAWLRRPLHLPKAAGHCPLTTAGGPVRPVGSPTRLAVSRFIGSSWEGAQVTWEVAGGYSGPVLIRGRELGGPHAVGFGEGHTPYDELQLLGPAMGAPRGDWPSFTRVRAPGCYAYQVDGTSFSRVIVFQAVGH